jgi:hypothetical protein
MERASTSAFSAVAAAASDSSSENTNKKKNSGKQTIELNGKLKQYAIEALGWGETITAQHLQSEL